MMTADQCLAKAEQMSLTADTASSYDAILQYELLAEQWRWLAMQAAWQDAWQLHNDHSGGT